MKKRGQVATMSEFFPDVPKIAVRRPQVAEPAGVQALQPRRGGRRQDDEGASAVLGRLLAYLLQSRCPTPSASARRSAPGTTAAGSVANAQTRVKVAFEFFEKLGVPVLRLPRPRRRPRGRDAQGEPRQPRRGRQGPQGRAGPHRRQAALGHGQPLLQPPIHARRGHQPEPRRLRLRRGAGQEGDGGHPRAGRRSATPSGAAARATRPC